MQMFVDHIALGASGADDADMRPSGPLSILGCALLFLTGCGSTVQYSSAVEGPDGTGDGRTSLGGTPSTSPGPGGSSGTGGAGTTGSVISSGTGGTGGAPSTATTGATTGNATGRSTTSGNAGSGGTSGASTGTGAATNGLGVTDTTITVGVTYTSNGDAANSAIGASGISQGDQRANIKALVDEINAHGGVAGRQLVAVTHPYDAQSTQSGNTQDESACSDFTQDHKVIAVFSAGLTAAFPQCLKKAGVVQFVAGALVGKDKVYSQTYPNAFQLGTMSQERILTDTVGALTRQNYFTGWNNLTGQPATTAAKVAVISYDGSSFKNAVAQSLLPALRTAGHPVATGNVFFLHQPESQSDVSGLVAGIKSATLRMQQDGVTHLVFNDANGLLLGLFSSNAQSQQYFPRFGVTTGAGAQAIYDSGLVKANQLNGLAGNGWLPTLDLPAIEGSKYATSATKRCLDIMKRRTGQTYTSTNAASIALISCDSFFLFVQALATAPSISPAGLTSGMEAIGRSFTSALLPASYLSPQQHDNGVRAYDLNWVSSCTCVRYSSPRSVPS